MEPQHAISSAGLTSVNDLTGATDAVCTETCSYLEPGQWPCGQGGPCVCSGSTATATTTSGTTATATTVPSTTATTTVMTTGTTTTSCQPTHMHGFM